MATGACIVPSSLAMSSSREGSAASAEISFADRSCPGMLPPVMTNFSLLLANATATLAANVSTIMGGIVVFGDPMPHDAVGIVLQVFAFVLVCAAALITPPPLRAAEANAVPA